MRSSISWTEGSSRVCSDLVRRCRLPWRRAEDLIVISRHGGPLRLVAKAKNSYYSPTPIIETEGMITSTGSPPQLGEKIIDAPHTPADTACHLNRLVEDVARFVTAGVRET